MRRGQTWLPMWLCLGLGVLLGLAGCGANNDQSTVFVFSSPSPSPSGSASPTGSPAATATAAPSSQPPLTGSQPTPIADGSRIIIDSPDASSAISSPVAVSGTASVRDGTVVGVVLDAAGHELGRATTTASASAPDFGHYDLTISFSGASSGARGQIKVFGVRPDGTTPTSYYFIYVRFS